MSDVILLSSDEECESPPPKRLKPTRIEQDVFEKLDSLTEINYKKYEETETVVVKKTVVEKDNLTIIIESDEIRSKENVVNLTEDSFEDAVKNGRSECFIVDSDEEKEDKEETEQTPPPTKEEEQQNGIVENGHGEEETEKIEIDILNRPSTSRASDAHKLLDEFLETCAKSMKDSKYECRVQPKFQKLKKNFDKCKDIHDEPNFKRLLQEYTATARISAPEAVVSFQRVWAYLLDNINGTGIDVTTEELLKLRKLGKTCKVLLKKIKKLEVAEVDFEDDDDSQFMQIDRLSVRLTKVYSKYCQLLKKSPHSGRLIYERINFVSSSYNEINRAITKYYNKDNKFPSYYDIERCIRKCVSKNNLDLSETEIKLESKHCFTNLGKLLQMRRKKELYEIHGGFIALNEDPATKDEELKGKLQASSQEGSQKMKEVVEKYVRMQESNVTVELSEDSDDSNYESESEGDREPVAE